MTDIEKYCDNLIQSVIASIKEKGGQQYLSSIILTGSFGRNEPTFKQHNGQLKLQSDVEIALIINNSPKRVAALIEQVSGEFEENLNLMMIDKRRIEKACNFNYTLITPRYKTVFTYDLFNGSRTIWGKDFLKSKIIEAKEIDPYEAKRLIANRIGELIHLQCLSKCEDDKQLRAQWKGKLVLAILSAWLICEREYVSSYHVQYAKACERRDDVEQDIGTGFFEDYKQVFSYLRDNGILYETTDERLREYVANINCYLKKQHINRSQVNSTSKKIKCFLKYIHARHQFGWCSYENNIIQGLLDAYTTQGSELPQIANVWYRVLY